MTKQRHSEAANTQAQEPQHKPETLPTITHLQFLVLDLLTKASDGLSAQLLKDGVAGVSPDYGGPKFYQLMGRLAEVDFVEITSRDIAVADGTVTRSFYKVTPAGAAAWRITTEFYSSRQHLRNAMEKRRP